MSEVKLLPCPWCGEKLASVSVSEGSTFRWRKVDGCCADGPEVRHNTMADDQEAAEVESRTAAIAAWNTRANLAERDAEVDALRAEVAKERDYAAQAANRVLKAELAQRNAESRAERLAEALRGVLPFVATQAIGCHGDKCREEWCYSCSGEEEAEEAAQRGREAFMAARAALDQESNDA